MENRIEDGKQVPATSNESSAVLSVFGTNSHFAFLYKKTEKLVAAIYLITDYIKDGEPLKNQIREAALDLISTNIKFSSVPLSERRELLKKYRSLSLEIISLAGIAHIGGLISEMNSSVLKREFEKLIAALEKDDNKKANEETVMLHPQFFDGVNNNQNSNVLYENPKGQTQKVEQNGPVNETPRPEKKVEYLSKPPKMFENKIDRKAIITKLLTKKSGLNIRDFAEAIRDCSEKTIQRELLAMVSSGILKKEGERRWSTYSLVK